MDIRQSPQRGSNGWALYEDHVGTPYANWNGYVITPEGFVYVFSQAAATLPNGHERAARTTYTMALGGHYYFLSEDRARTKRGLIIMAGKFARKASRR